MDHKDMVGGVPIWKRGSRDRAVQREFLEKENVLFWASLGILFVLEGASVKAHIQASEEGLGNSPPTTVHLHPLEIFPPPGPVWDETDISKDPGCVRQTASVLRVRWIKSYPVVTQTPVHSVTTELDRWLSQECPPDPQP